MLRDEIVQSALEWVIMMRNHGALWCRNVHRVRVTINPVQLVQALHSGPAVYRATLLHR